MALKHVRSAGPGNVPSYQMSGVPYVTSSLAAEVTTTPIKVSFPFVTRFMVITNLSSNDLRVGFSANGVSGAIDANYFIIPGDAVSPRLELRCKEVYFQEDSGATGFSLVAGLTNIHDEDFPVLTGSIASGETAFKGIG